MKKTTMAVWVFFALAGGLFLSFLPHTTNIVSADEHAEEHALYTCGMHPNVIQEGPGSCPICGMDLTPMKAATTTKESGNASAEGAIIVDPVTVQNMGIRTIDVTEGRVWRNIRSVGEIQTPEDGLSVVNLRVSGWIETIYANETGQKINKDDPLFSFYSPALIAAQEEYILAVRSAGPKSTLAKSAKRRLELWGVPRAHLRQVLNTGNGQKLLTVLAPNSGYTLEKHVLQGAHVKAGQDLYLIGDLGHVWVEAEVYEFDAPYVSVGLPATIELPYEGGDRRSSTVRYIYPTLDPKTRTLRVRLVLDNSEGHLKPGMFATVRIEAEGQEGVLIIPSEAILYTGERNLVFVSTSLGHYAARDVRVGLVGDNGMTEIRSGLRLDETVVVSGQFLLDSEAQLQEAVQKMLRARLQGNTQTQATPVPHPTEYRCPLHPALISKTEPGECPIDGLKLQAFTPQMGGKQ